MCSSCCVRMLTRLWELISVPGVVLFCSRFAICAFLMSCIVVLSFRYIWDSYTSSSCARQRTLELFQSNTGFTVEERPNLWDQWRSDCVTALVRDVCRTAKSIRPQIVLTAAVGAERLNALSHFQVWNCHVSKLAIHCRLHIVSRGSRSCHSSVHG